MGRRIAIGREVTDDTVWREIVGVVGDETIESLTAPWRMEMFVPAGQEVLECAGLALGLAAITLLGPALEAVLYEVRPDDPASLAAGAAVLAAAALLAAWLPARRASRVDPLETLRVELRPVRLRA